MEYNEIEINDKLILSKNIVGDIDDYPTINEYNGCVTVACKDAEEGSYCIGVTADIFGKEVIYFSIDEITKKLNKIDDPEYYL